MPLTQWRKSPKLHSILNPSPFFRPHPQTLASFSQIQLDGLGNYGSGHSLTARQILVYSVVLKIAVAPPVDRSSTFKIKSRLLYDEGSFSTSFA